MATVGEIRSADTSARERHLMRRADASGQRLFRELVASRIAWATVSEASRMIAVDLVAFSVRAPGCDHPQPCELHHCQDQLAVTAVVGNRGRRLPGLRLRAGHGIGGRVLETGTPTVADSRLDAALDDELLDLVVGEEGLTALAAIPVAFGGEVRAVLHAGLRGPSTFPPAAIDALSRLCTYAGAALAAARDRRRVEEIAAARERRRLARALHDEFGQRLFTLGLAARNARSSALTGSADLITVLGHLEQQIAEASGAFRATLKTLAQPSAPSGVVIVTIREDAAAFTNRAGIEAHVLVLGEPGPVDEARADLLVRTVRECLRNVERHAAADEVVITIAFAPDGAIELVVQDDGVGLRDRDADGMGTASLRAEYERLGGGVRLQRGEDTGTTVRAVIPA